MSPAMAPSAVPGGSEDRADDMPVPPGRFASETDRTTAEDSQDADPNEEGIGATAGPEAEILPAGMPIGGPPDPGYRIRGRVVSPEGPIQDEPGQWPRTLVVQVDAPAYARQCLLDEDGRFECSGLDAGTYVVSVGGLSQSESVHSSLLCEAVEVTLTPSAPLAEPVLILGKEAAVTVVVWERDSFLPRANEAVVAKSVTGLSEVSGHTDDQGCCVLGLIPGRYWIDANPWEGRGKGSTPQLLIVEPDAQGLSVQLFVPARKERKLCFTLVDSQGNPVKGYVDLDMVAPASDRQPADTVSIPDSGYGAFGQLVGYAHDASGGLARSFICAEEAWADGMMVVLEPRAGIVGRLLPADGLPAAALRLDLQLCMPDERWRSVDKSLYRLVVDGDGRFQFDGVPVGLNVRVTATAGRHQGESDSLTLRPDGTYDVGEIAVRIAESAPATGAVYGRVIDENGRSPSDRMIRIWAAGTRMRIPMNRGRFSVYGVSTDRPVTIRVAIPGIGSCAATAMAGEEECIFQVDTRGGGLSNAPAPALVVDRWINHAPMTWEQLRGRVVLLTFRDLDEEMNPQDRNLPAILSVYREYRSKGLLVIAVYGHVPEDGPLDREHVVRCVLHCLRGTPIAGCLDADPALVADLLPADGPREVFAGATHCLYQVHLSPALFLIDKQGRVRCCPDLAGIRGQIDLLLQE